jgi:hypothetical protein
MASETARAVLDGRIDAVEGARTLEVQQRQIGDRLRSDRIDVTQAEADEVALTLRRLAEQVADRASGEADPTAHLAIAQALGALAATLR